MNVTTAHGQNRRQRLSILLDTNVWVYFYDPREPSKQAFARHLLSTLKERKIACLSAQVLAEFANLAPRKLGMTHFEVYEQVTSLIQAWPVFDLTSAVITEAARGRRDHSLAYYDAQIWATAKLNQIPAIFSEDFNSGATLEGVRFVNPFVPTFNLDDWT